jgi:superoxide dismutase
MMSIELPPLPYPLNALEPHISSITLEIHHHKHHRAYVDKTKALIAGTALANLSLEEILSMVAPRKNKSALFNNAAQAWNHEFYWNSMSPNWRARASRCAGRSHRERLRKFYTLRQGPQGSGDGTFWERLGLAGAS